MIKVRENQNGQSRIDNPEKLATLGTQNTWWRHTKAHTQTKKTKKNKQTSTQRAKQMSNTDPTTYLGWTQVFAKGKLFLSL